MNFQFDHLVHFVKHPLVTIEELKTQGLHAVEGGKHENYGTYNALCYFDLSYIELIGVFDQQLADKATGTKYSLRDTFQKDNYIEGFSRVALRSSNLEVVAEHFRNAGLEVFGPAPLSRRRPDGSVVSWKLLFAGNPNDQVELPFFIQWDESDEDRKQDLIHQSAIAPHQAGNVSLSSVGFAVNDVEKVVENWSKYLDLQVGESFIDESLQAKGQRLILAGGDLVFYSPIGEGLVSKTLEERGEKPFIVEFSGANENTQFELCGATYRLTK